MDPSALPADVRALLSAERVPELGPGQPNAVARPALAALTVEALFGGASVRRSDCAQCCLSGLWLLHNYLDESHTISQDLAGADGSYWHALMHRREPDAANAAYWFRRVGTHPIYAQLAAAAGSRGLRLKNNRWDPYEFIDLCEAQRGTGTPEEALLRALQRVEWDLLFAYCYDHAAAPLARETPP